MKLIGKGILVERLKKDNKTAGGIILPAEKHKDNDCNVLMVGPKVEYVNIGDTISRYPNSGSPYKHEGKDCLFLKEDKDVEFVH